MFQDIRYFETRCLLTIVYVSTSKKTLKLSLNIRIILASIKIQLLQNQQLVNCFVKYLNNKSISRILFSIFYVLSLKKKKKHEKYLLLSTQSNCSYFQVLMITLNKEWQPPEVFFKKTCSQKFHKIHRKTTVPTESLF